MQNSVENKNNTSIGLFGASKKKAMLCAYFFKVGQLSVTEICKLVGVFLATYYKYLDYEGLGRKKREYKKSLEIK